jgi:hypothetical protein
MPKREIDVDDETYAKIQELIKPKDEEHEDFIVFRGTAADFAKQFGFTIKEAEEGEGGEGEGEGEGEGKKKEPNPKSRARYFS